MLPPSPPTPVKLEDRNYLFVGENSINFPSLIHGYLYTSTNKEENGNSLDTASASSLLQQPRSV